MSVVYALVTVVWTKDVNSLWSYPSILQICNLPTVTILQDSKHRAVMVINDIKCVIDYSYHGMLTLRHMHKYVYTATQLSIGLYVFSLSITSIDPYPLRP